MCAKQIPVFEHQLSSTFLSRRAKTRLVFSLRNRLCFDFDRHFIVEDRIHL
ncbi:MAG: hypothetical protein NT080_08685 [Spirochaetes bacterium]|nr:hypothetical protein [Spirochaetota bacterium]